MTALAALLLLNCNDKSAPTEPITGFDLEKYLGKWYEIARLDHRFERNMQNVNAEYSLRDDGKVKVINRGFKNDKWKKAVGNAKFAQDENTGFLKVSFFGPFYGSYIIYELADDYSYAFVSGDNKNYLWLLSRTKTVSDELMDPTLYRLRVPCCGLGYSLSVNNYA